MTTNRLHGLTRSVVLLLACILVLAALAMAPARAYEETQFLTIENASYNDLSSNITLTFVDQNATPVYTVDYSVPAVRVIPLGLDLQFQLLVCIAVCLLIITAIMVIRSAYSLMNWVLSRGG